MILYTLLSRSGSRLSSLLLGLAVVGVGTYFLLRNTLGFTLPAIDWDIVWPVPIIITGLIILSRAAADSISSEHPRQRALDTSPRPAVGGVGGQPDLDVVAVVGAADRGV